MVKPPRRSCACGRYNGYDGSYDMDGTRHLTKTFLQRAGAKNKRVPEFQWPKVRLITKLLLIVPEA